MSAIFEIIKEKDDTYSIGIRVKIGEHESLCPVTGPADIDGLKVKAGSITDELNAILDKLDKIKNGSPVYGGLNPDADPKELWAEISAISDNDQMAERFNSLDEQKRKELAEYIFANCNMFSGKGAFFSAQYVQETALLAV